MISLYRVKRCGLHTRKCKFEMQGGLETAVAGSIKVAEVIGYRAGVTGETIGECGVFSSWGDINSLRI